MRLYEDEIRSVEGRDAIGLFIKLPPGYVVDEDRAEGWTPVDWHM
jgi:hypothetical protein